LAGLFEETGWTGFALPRLQARYSPLASGLILGTLWAIWHGMADFWGNIATLGLLWLPNFVAYWLVPLTAYRILIVWVHKNTNSLLAAQLMHAFYTGTLIAVTPSTPDAEAMFWKALFGITIWVALLLVVIKFGERLSNPHK
jgi:membrane protease YdiL (CAAX protease family)